MYIPPYFEITDRDALHALIRNNAFGILFTHGSNGMAADHLPFELQVTEGKPDLLHAHVSRHNPVWQDVKNGDEVLVVFSAGDAYISPQWYPSKLVHHQQVPTWNYSTVHAYGRITIRDDERYVRGIVARLTRTHEASMPVPWKMTDGPQDYINTLLKSVVGIEIEVVRLIGKAKLSQNKDKKDRQGVIQHLKEKGEHHVSEAMMQDQDMD